MGANSRVKGQTGERELCKLLSGIFSGSFIRAPHSGAQVGGKNVHRRQTFSKTQDRTFRGDIIPPDHLPRLVIEAKSYDDFRFHQLLQPGPCAMLDDWIAQAMAVLDPGDQWFVVYKINRRGWFLTVPEAECADYRFANHCAYTGKYGAYRITDMLDFFITNRDMVLQKAGSLDKPTCCGIVAPSNED
jgi:hypothetical protein